jgi:hypothetical protein
MVITDPIALPPGPRTAEATGRFITRLPTPTQSGRPTRAQPQPAPLPKIPLRPRWLGWR